MTTELGQINQKSRMQLLWLLGDWHAICREVGDGNDTCEISHLKMVALLQLGRTQEARNLFNNLLIDKNTEIKKLLLSGLYNTLAKANYLSGKLKEANKYFEESVKLISDQPDITLLTKLRMQEQLAQINIFQRWISAEDLKSEKQKRRLFIDCGGHDGCSAIKFLLANPNYDVITFEANPELWKFYERIPTELRKEAVYDYDGEVEFIIDPIDADGSSLIKEKNIDFHKKVKNEDCPRINIACIDLSLFVQEQSKKYEEIVLKLDVEGAEYAILKKMLKDGTLKLVKKLFAEFHWNKIGISEETHRELLEKVMSITPVEHWDAQEFSVYAKDKSAITRRSILLAALGN